MPTRSRALSVFTNQQIIDAATGRWGEAANEVKIAEPYEIDTPNGDKITVAPLTRRRRKALKAAQAAYMMAGAQLVQVEQEQNADQSVIDRIQSLIDQADERYNQALFGDAYQQVVDYYEDLQEEFWNAMYEDIHEALVNRISLPEGTCPKCGQALPDSEDGEGEGKDESSSTSSTDTGTKSKGTSKRS